MSCRNEQRFDGILCGDCGSCELWKFILKDDWLKFKDDWYASYLWQKRRRETYKEEIRYKVLGERYHNFVTINFSKEDNPHDKLEILKEWGYFEGEDKGVIEYNTNKGKHLHFHIISYKKRKVPNIIRDISKKFKIKSNFVDVNNVPKRYDIHIEYINGVKVDKKKNLIDEDNEWRSKNNLPKIIYFSST